MLSASALDIFRMNVYYNYQLQRKFDFMGWTPVQSQEAGAGGSAPQTLAGSMEPLPAHSPDSDTDYEHKRRRLSALLDRLSVHITNNNNNNNSPPSWTPDNRHSESTDDELPLDLSLKSEKAQTSESFSCNDCGQTFALHDRLTKHIASRHRSKTEGVKAYACVVCCRRFARSDMLTRHERLHSGVKPYSCMACGQVFSRSDHLATHQRTHTGEKPYRCPNCPYAACRRDMITRHMRTHLRRAQPA